MRQVPPIWCDMTVREVLQKLLDGAIDIDAAEDAILYDCEDVLYSEHVDDDDEES